MRKLIYTNVIIVLIWFNQINQKNILPIQEYQEKGQIPSQIQNQQYLDGNKNENTFQINTNINSEVHGQAKNRNNQQTTQEGKNYGFFLSEGKNNTLMQRKDELNPSYIYKIPQTKEELFSVNSKLVDAIPYNFKGQLYPLRNIKNIQQTPQFPIKRQFYRLIEAIPINVGNNAKVNLYQCNNCSYLVQPIRNTYDINNVDKCQNRNKTKNRMDTFNSYENLTQPSTFINHSNNYQDQYYSNRNRQFDNFDEDLYEEGMKNYDQQYYINPNYNVYEYEQNPNYQQGENQNKIDNNCYTNENLYENQYPNQYEEQQEYQNPQEYQNENEEIQENEKIEFCTCDKDKNSEEKNKEICKDEQNKEGN